MKLTTLLLPLFLISTQANAASATSLWNNEGGDAGHSGYVDVKTDPAKFKVVWNKSIVSTQEIDGLSLTNTTITDHMLYATVRVYSHLGDPGINGVYALNSATGETVWKISSPASDYFSSCPVFYNGKIYWTTEHQTNFLLTAVDAETGSPQLTSTLDYKAGISELSDPVMFDHHFYFGDKKGYQYSVSGDTGMIDWALQSGDETTEPTVVGDYVIRANYPGIDIINRQTGEKSFIHVTDNQKFTESTPVWDDKSKTLYVVASSLDANELNAIDLTQGIVKWKLSIKGYLAQPVVAGDVIYVCDFSTLYEVNAVTGKINWSLLIDKGFQDMIVTPDLVFVSPNDGKTRAISRKTHRVVWTSNKTGKLSMDANRLYLIGNKDFSGVEVTAIALN